MWDFAPREALVLNKGVEFRPWARPKIRIRSFMGLQNFEKRTTAVCAGMPTKGWSGRAKWENMRLQCLQPPAPKSQQVFDAPQTGNSKQDFCFCRVLTRSGEDLPNAKMLPPKSRASHR